MIRPGSPMDVIQWYLMFAALSIFWYFMRDISRRLGEALHTRPYYLLYDLGEVLLVTAVVMLFSHFVLGVKVPVGGIDVFPLAAKGMFALATLVYVAVTFMYWGWIVPEVLAPRKK